MSFRDGWMKVGKASKRAADGEEAIDIAPLHLVLIEEPEAHLHAQVQQVFIRKAYDILRKHADLGNKPTLSTQLVISTHSSHIAHECEFASLRYFRRLPAKTEGKVPVSCVVNLSEVFGTDGETERFVTRYLKATHCDLFFADAAVLVEGPAERMLVPHFIRSHYKGVSEAYVTILEIGGSHAHRFRPLIDKLGLITLIVTDLDAAEGTGVHATAPPARKKGLVTRNATLKSWIPGTEWIDELLDLPSDKKTREHDLFYGIRVAYQVPVSVKLTEGGDTEEALSTTFEDALVFENLQTFRALDGDGMTAKIRAAIAASHSVPALDVTLLEILKKGNKAEFALDILYLRDPKLINVPTYIAEGLMWLEKELKGKQLEVIKQVDVAVAKAQG